MTMKQAAWQHRNPDVDAENCFYGHANCLHEGPNVSRKRKPLRERWWFILAELLVIILGLVALVVF